MSINCKRSLSRIKCFISNCSHANNTVKDIASCLVYFNTSTNARWIAMKFCTDMYPQRMNYTDFGMHHEVEICGVKWDVSASWMNKMCESNFMAIHQTVVATFHFRMICLVTNILNKHYTCLAACCSNVNSLKPSAQPLCVLLQTRHPTFKHESCLFIWLSATFSTLYRVRCWLSYRATVLWSHVCTNQLSSPECWLPAWW